MTTTIETAEREVIVVEDAHIRPMMGMQVLESLPGMEIPYSLVDPFILVHEAVMPITPEWAKRDTEHPHRGFDNLWYVLAGEASTGHSTGPGGTMERARLKAGSLLKIRTGRGVRHAEGRGIAADARHVIRSRFDRQRPHRRIGEKPFDCDRTGAGTDIPQLFVAPRRQRRLCCSTRRYERCCAPSSRRDRRGYTLYDGHPLDEPDEWGDLRSFREAAAKS